MKVTLVLEMSMEEMLHSIETNMRFLEWLQNKQKPEPEPEPKPEPKPEPEESDS